MDESGRYVLRAAPALTENRAYYERLGYRPVEYRTHAGYTAPTYVILAKDLTP